MSLQYSQRFAEKGRQRAATQGVTMANEGTEKLVDLVEKALMIHLHSMGVAQGDIAKMLSKSKTDVNSFLKPIAKGKR
jgi:hypothetical protein